MGFLIFKEKNMALSAMTVPTTFTANDRFSSVINTMARNTNNFASGVSRLNNRINNEMTSMTRVAKYAAVAAGTALFYKAGDDIIEYEKAINSLGAVTGTVVGSMNKQIQSLGKETGRSVIDITKSFEIVGSKMSQYLDNPEALKKITKASVLMADAARMELEPAIESLTGVLNIYGKSAEDALYIVNKLSAGEIVGSISIAQTADILRQFGGTARLANVQVDESIALIQTLTKSLGVEGVGRGIRNVMTDLNMVGAFDKNKTKALVKAGVDMDILGDKSLDLVTRLTELKKLEGNSAAMGLFFKKTGIQTGATLFQNFDDYIRFLKAIKETNKAQEQADKNNATLARGIKYLKDSFTNFIVTNQNANMGISATKSLIGWMIPNMGLLVNLIASVAIAFVGWKVIVGIVSLISGIMTAFTAIMSAHRFVVLWATLTNTGYAASLWAVAAATLAAYWPLLLIAGALGLLVYAFWDTGNATDDMVSKQISALSKGDAALMNSTNVMSSELKKQNKIMAGQKPQLSIAERNKSMLSTYNLSKEKIKAATIQNLKLPKEQQLSKEALNYQVRSGDYKFEDSKFQTKKNESGINSKTYKNLSGMQQLDMKSFSENMKQNVEVTIIDKGNNAESVKVNGKNYGGGIPAKTNSTTGVKN